MYKILYLIKVYNSIYIYIYIYKIHKPIFAHVFKYLLFNSNKTETYREQVAIY
jgi:hypothetical protein